MISARSTFARKRFQSIRLLALAVCFFVSAAALANDAWTFTDVGRVVAISDIHGDYDAMVRTLSQAGVIDKEGAWTSGDAHLVIVGDILDRAGDSRAAMDHLMRLEDEALAAGGRVHVLFGNHEAMNMMGDLRYVHPGEYASFADDETAEEREGWFARYAERAGESSGLPDFRARFDERFPPGYFAHRRAFSNSGYYGQWLLEKPIIVVINEVAFVHAGLSPRIAEYGLEGVNRTLFAEFIEFMRLHEELTAAGVLLPTDTQREFESVLAEATAELPPEDPIVTKAARLLEVNDSELHAVDGPMWYRGNVHCSRLIEEDRLVASLEAIGATRVVVGHTPTPTRTVLERFDGRLFEIDTGMSAEYYKGKGNALMFDNDGMSFVDENGATGLPHEHPRRVGVRPNGIASRQALETFLAEADVLLEQDDEYGRRVVTLGDSSRKAEAFFTRRPGRDFHPDVAAYRLDMLLELGMVPVAVERKVGRSEGSLLYIAPKSWDEQRRAEAGRGGSATCPLPDQWDAMFVFDALIYNEGRSQNRILYSTDRWQLMLVGHEFAFGTRKGRPKTLESVDLVISPAWRKALEELTEERIATEFDGVLDKRRQKALLQRRDALLESP